MKKQEIIIKIQGLNKSFSIGGREIPVLRGIDFEAAQGEMIVIFGPSGCGKSTFLNVILGLEPPTEGKVEILEEDVYKLSPKEATAFRIRRIGMVQQLPVWIRSLSALENIALPLLNLGFSYKSAIKRAKKYLKNFGLEKLADRQPSTLSGGEQQRLTIAQAVITEPLIILADEPTGNLDTLSSRRTINELQRLNKELGRLIILATHDPRYLTLSDVHFYYMEDGRMKSTNPQEINTQLKSI